MIIIDIIASYIILQKEIAHEKMSVKCNIIVTGLTVTAIIANIYFYYKIISIYICSIVNYLYLSFL